MIALKLKRFDLTEIPLPLKQDKASNERAKFHEALLYHSSTLHEHVWSHVRYRHWTTLMNERYPTRLFPYSHAVLRRSV